MTEQESRQYLLSTAREMNSSGLSQGTAGNLSVRVNDGFLITPSALPYSQCTEADMVMIDMAGSCQSSRKPSSEWRLHRDIYLHHPRSRAILHAHPPWCTTLACLEREIPAFHYMVALAGGDRIPCAEYALFGSQELSDKVIAAMGTLRACLLGHHGMVCHTVEPQNLLPLALEVELLARIYVQALQVCEPPLLTEAEMTAAINRFSSYRP